MTTTQRGRVRVIATPVLAGELQPGDLFSGNGQEDWDEAMGSDGVAVEAYIRTELPCPAGQEGIRFYRLTIQRSFGGEVGALL